MAKMITVRFESTFIHVPRNTRNGPAVMMISTHPIEIRTSRSIREFDFCLYNA